MCTHLIGVVHSLFNHTVDFAQGFRHVFLSQVESQGLEIRGSGAATCHRSETGTGNIDQPTGSSTGNTWLKVSIGFCDKTHTKKNHPN